MFPLLLTKLDKETADFISSLVTQGEYKSKLVSLSLAKALSMKLALPSTQVEDVGLHFAMSHKQACLNAILLVNELITVNVDEVLDLTKRFYVYRYNCIFVQELVPYVNKDTAVEDFFGISRVFSPDSIALINEHNSKLTSYVNRFITLIEKIQEQ